MPLNIFYHYVNNVYALTNDKLKQEFSLKTLLQNAVAGDKKSSSELRKFLSGTV